MCMYKYKNIQMNSSPVPDSVLGAFLEKNHLFHEVALPSARQKRWLYQNLE